MVDLRALPKAELHLHLEATICADLVGELTDRYGRPAPSTGPFGTLTEFVVAYERARDLIGSLDDLHRVARELGQRQQADGVVWTEVHLIPSTYAGRLGDPNDLVAAVLDGLRLGAGADGAGIVLGINRGLSVEEAEHTVDLALRWVGRGVVALGLAGDEANHPGHRFRDAFARAASYRVPGVPHAGEGAGPGSVRDTVEALAPTRICHGVRAIEDDALVDLLAERRICLDLAPTSNVRLGGYRDLESHPLPELMRRGVPVTLNSDIPTFIGHGLLEEYESCARAWGLEAPHLVELAATSLRYSFCPDHVRDPALERCAVSLDAEATGSVRSWARRGR